MRSLRSRSKLIGETVRTFASSSTLVHVFTTSYHYSTSICDVVIVHSSKFNNMSNNYVTNCANLIARILVFNVRNICLIEIGTNIKISDIFSEVFEVSNIYLLLEMLCGQILCFS